MRRLGNSATLVLIVARTAARPSTMSLRARSRGKHLPGCKTPMMGTRHLLSLRSGNCEHDDAMTVPNAPVCFSHAQALSCVWMH